MSVRIVISPTSPTSTSRSWESTSRTSMPGRARPQLPAMVGFHSLTIGAESSVML